MLICVEQDQALRIFCSSFYLLKLWQCNNETSQDGSFIRQNRLLCRGTNLLCVGTYVVFVLFSHFDKLALHLMLAVKKLCIYFFYVERLE